MAGQGLKKLFGTQRLKKIGRHTCARKAIQTENTAEGEVKGGCFDKNKHVCLNRHKDGFSDRLGCPNRSILINSMRFSEVNSEWENILSSTRILETLEINIWRDV